MQPSTPEQKQVATLPRAANRSLETASSLVKCALHLYESVGFSCQQAAAQYCKAPLIAIGQPASFIHILSKAAGPFSYRKHHFA